MRTRSQRNGGACAPRRRRPGGSAAASARAPPTGRGPARAPGRAPGPGPGPPCGRAVVADAARQRAPHVVGRRVDVEQPLPRRAGRRARRVGARDRRRVAEGLDQERVQGLGLGDASPVARLERRSAATSSNPSSRTNAASRTARRCGGGTAFSERGGDGGAGASGVRPPSRSGRRASSAIRRALSTASACRMASSARRCSSLSRSESRSQSAICSAARFWCRVFCDGLAARLRGLPAELGTMCRSACTSRSGGGGPSRRGIALAPGNILPEALGRGRGVGVGGGTARSPGAVPGGAEQAATPSPLWLVPGGSAATFLLPPLKGRWGPLCGGHFLLPAGPWGPAGWRRSGSEGWGKVAWGV